MAKNTGPLFSLEARGSLSHALTFSKRKSGQQVRFQRKQKDVITTLRTAQRLKFQTAVSWWSELNANEKEEWNVLTK